jgi:RHS repeat-associated protein
MFTQNSRGSQRASRVLQRAAGFTCFFFSWLATAPSFGEALRTEPHRPGRQRTLALSEMRHIVGSQISIGSGSSTTGRAPIAQNDGGSPLPWEGETGDTNTTNGNKLTNLPIVEWGVRGDRLSVDLTLFHNSLSTRNDTLGHHWSHSYDISLTKSGLADYIVQWGDSSAYAFTEDMSGDFTPPPGIYDGLVTTSGTGSSRTLILTTKDQIRYIFTPDPVTTDKWLVTEIKDRNDNTITLSRGGSGQVTTVTDPTLRTLSLSYSSGKLVSITDPTSRVWTISYSSGELVQVDYPSVTVGGSPVTYHTDFAYDGNHRITTLTDRRGKDWTFSYNVNGSLAWERDPLLNQTTYTYYTNYTIITDANGHDLRHNYDGNGRLSSVKDGTSQTETTTFGIGADFYNPVTVTDKRNHNWTYTYDSMGNVLTKTDPLSHTTTFTYTALNDVDTVTTHLGHVTDYGYDGDGNLTSVSDPLSHATTITVDSYGQVTEVEDALSHSTTMTYDSDGNTIVVTEPIGYTSYDHDGLGRVTSVIDPTGYETTTAFDNLGRISSITAPGTRTTTYTYDGEDNPLTITDPLNRTDTITYDDAGRITTHVDRNGIDVSFGYDYVGNKTSFTDGNGHITTYSYNNRNQLSGITYPDSTGDSLTYKATGELWTKTDGRGVTTTYSYDNAGRVTGKTYSDATPSVSFSYDNDNRKTGMTDGIGTTTYSYDNASRLTSRAAPAGTVSFSYDNADNMLTRTIAGTDVTTFTYDDNDRIVEVEAVGATQTTLYEYDDAGREIVIERANGTIETYYYDPYTADQFYRLDHRQHPTYGMMDVYEYTYDACGRKTREQGGEGDRDFTYDNGGRLIEEERFNSVSPTGTLPNDFTATYTYDDAGNRLTKTVDSGSGPVTEYYTYDDANKLLTAGPKTYTYDYAGNVYQVSNSSTSITETLTWDAESRLIGATDGTTSNTYVYNGLGQRVEKTDSAGTFDYTVQDDSIDSAVLSDGSSTYIRGAGNDLLSEMRDLPAGPTEEYYHQDGLGSTRFITDYNETIKDKIARDAFGMVVAEWHSSAWYHTPTSTPFGFVGQAGYQTDKDTGLMMLGHRYYDSSTGRFISRDPIQAGYNWYTYCENDPVNMIDPQGQAGWPPDNTVYRDIDGAVAAALRSHFPDAVAKNREVVGLITKVTGGYMWGIYPVIPGTEREVVFPSQFPPQTVAVWHPHQLWEPPGSDTNDQWVADYIGLPVYTGKTSGEIWKNTPRPDHKYDDPPAENTLYTGPGTSMVGYWGPPWMEPGLIRY